MRLKSTILAIAAAACASIATTAIAAPNLVQNGGFEIHPTVTSDITGLSAHSVTSWTNGNLASWLVFDEKISSPLGTPIYSPGEGYANGLVASPAGGDFIAMDGDATYAGPLTQTITGLNVGGKYVLSFYSAGGQLYGQNGATTESWTTSLGTVSLANPVQKTAVVNNLSHGFTGWTQQSFTFTANATSEVLSFLAVGTPQGVPPMSLLDGVTLSAVPEPATWTLMLAGFGAVGFTTRRRRNIAAA